jgi:UDP-N-acetylmuramoylalanine--D-glutamate ligase
MGLGRFGGGVAAARWYAERGDDVLVTDLRDETTLAASLAEIEPLGVELRLGRHDPDDFRSADLVVVNPAVPFDNPLVRLAPRHVTEIGVTLRHLPGPIVAVTGTNGKSTTVSLIAAMLEAAGIPHALGGNIGRPLLNETASMSSGTVAVLELSSFQLAWLEHDEWSAVAAVVTNLSGDHLDRHKTFEHYARSKRRLAERVSPEGVLILNRADEACRSFADACPGRVEWFTPEDAAGPFGLAGRHNRANAAAAIRAALAVGASREACADAMAGFRPLPHRLEDLGERAGVLRVNDSVSTTPEATAAAVDAFARPVILLTGGRDKGLDLGPLVAAAQRAKRVVAYGESGPGLRSSLPAAELRPGLDAAVRAALELAEPGDVVLLSPGFASYDEFPGFDARGDRFRQLIAE